MDLDDTRTRMNKGPFPPSRTQTWALVLLALLVLAVLVLVLCAAPALAARGHDFGGDFGWGVGFR